MPSTVARALEHPLLARAGAHRLRVLTRLAEAKAQTMSGLAESLGCHAPSISRTLRTFEDGGLVRMRPDPADGRRVLVSLTRVGRRQFGFLAEQKS